MFDHKLLEPINNFLRCSTPDKWIEEACKPENLSVILRDHLLCELKASQSAVFLLNRYVLTDAAKQQLKELVEPYELFAYKRIGSLATLKGKSNISKSIKSKRRAELCQNPVGWCASGLSARFDARCRGVKQLISTGRIG